LKKPRRARPVFETASSESRDRFACQRVDGIMQTNNHK
jgi:hypothetical protein